jgi:hypothetical protein
MEAQGNHTEFTRTVPDSCRRQRWGWLSRDTTVCLLAWLRPLSPLDSPFSPTPMGRYAFRVLE